MTTGGTIVWNLDVSDSKFKKGLADARAEARKTGDELDKSGQAFGRLGSAAANAAKTAAFALGAIAGSVSIFGLKTAGDLESARQGFVTLLGSAEEADKILGQIKKDAAKTPFELTGLIKANQALTSVTKNGERSENILLDVGKALAASGKGQEELDRIIFNLQQIGNTSEITELDIRQFGYAGVNILELLADYYGVSKEAAGDMVKNSKDAFGDLEKAFAKAGGAGGKFENAFKDQAGTFNQLVSNMKDSFTIFTSDFVKQTGIFDISKKAIGNLTKTIVDNKEAIIDTVINIGKKLSEMARVVAEYLQPKFKALWDTIKESMPTFERLWKEVIQPLAEVIGTVLVAALGLAIDALNLLLTVLTPIIQFMLDNKVTVLTFIGLFGLLAIALKFDDIASAFMGNMDLIIGAVGKAKTNVVNFIDYIKSPGALGAFGLLAAAAVIAAAVIIDAGNKAKAAWDNTAKAVQNASKSNDEVLKNLQNLAKNGTPEQKQRAKATLKGLAEGGAFASGTNFAPGGLSLVGERGPELVNLPKGSQVIPNNKTEDMLGGQKYVYNIGTINIDSAVDGERWLKKLTRNQEIFDNGLTPSKTAM